jgi:hypothetical protein
MNKNTWIALGIVTLLSAAALVVSKSGTVQHQLGLCEQTKPEDMWYWRDDYPGKQPSTTGDTSGCEPQEPAIILYKLRSTELPYSTTTTEYCGETVGYEMNVRDGVTLVYNIKLYKARWRCLLAAEDDKQ